MNLQQKLIDSIGVRPTLAIKFVYWVSFVLTGLFILSPWYTPDAAPALRDGLNSLVATKVYAGILVATGSIGLYALANLRWPRRQIVLRHTMFATFLILMFFALLRITTYGINEIVWVSYFINALIAGIVHMRLRWESSV